MMFTDLFYIAIPLINSLGNIVLKLSVEQKNKKKLRRFAVMQFIGYSIFVVVMVFSYLFLITHQVSQFVVIFSLTYLSTLYVSRWYFKEMFTTRDVIYDMLIVFGIVVFFWGTL